MKSVVSKKNLLMGYCVNLKCAGIYYLLAIIPLLLLLEWHACLDMRKGPLPYVVL
jgi:hypothetical protein